MGPRPVSQFGSRALGAEAGRRRVQSTRRESRSDGEDKLVAAGQRRCGPVAVRKEVIVARRRETGKNGETERAADLLCAVG
jgi:hypothetical protein